MVEKEEGERMNIINLNKYTKKVMAFFIMILLVSGNVFSHGSMRNDRFYHGGGFHNAFHEGHGWYGHGGGFFMGPRWFWGPTVIIGDIPYYYYDGSYYTYNDGDMVAVEAPIEKPKPVTPTSTAVTPGTTAVSTTSPEPSAVSVTPQKKDQPINEVKPAGAPDESVTINIPNEKGGFTAIKLVKHDKGYIGPQGEFYSDHPTVEQLKALYGK
jgi:hypothetical protein